MPNYEHPQLHLLVEQAFQLHRLLFQKSVDISSATGLKVGEILERIAYMCDADESSIEAFVAFDESEFAGRQISSETSSPPLIVLTLQDCLKTFEQTCQCGQCAMCTRGQDEIKRVIAALESLTRRAIGAASRFLSRARQAGFSIPA